MKRASTNTSPSAYRGALLSAFLCIAMLLSALILVPASAGAQKDGAPRGGPRGQGTPPAELCQGQTPSIVGTNGADHLVGTDGNDVIVGMAGNDTIDGLGGDDLICGGNGDDVISGGGGADEIHGDNGADLLHGGPGADLLVGGNGKDELFGEDGADRLDGGTSIDLTDGGPAADGCLAETTIDCERDNLDDDGSGVDAVPGVRDVDFIPWPENPQPLRFGANTNAVDGVDLVIDSPGGLYPWDIRVERAYTTERMRSFLVSELVDLQRNPDAPEFTTAELTMSYDPALVTVDEAALRIHVYEPEAQLWLPVPGIQTVDTDANTVTANLEHFSIYGIPDVGQPSDWQRILGDTPVQCVADDADLGVSVSFMIDTSGSMGSNDPSDLRVDAAKAFVDEMGTDDEVGVVTFSGSGVTRIGLTPLLDQAARGAVSAALDRAALDSGGTDIGSALRVATSMLSSAAPGRPRIGILLTDGDGDYRTADALGAVSAGITVHTFGLGAGINASVLTEIADLTGGTYTSLTSADQLVPLYEQLGGTIFDDGTDTDGDTLTDCVETNGAFVPAVSVRAWKHPTFLVTTTTIDSSYVTLNPDDPDTDGDTVNDGVELVEADLRTNPDIAAYYSFLIDAGLTRYYREISDPLDPFDPSANVGLGELTDFFRPGLLDVDDLALDNRTLFQPDRYPERPVIDARLLADRTAGGVNVQILEYTAPPVVYETDEDCAENCDAVFALATERQGDGVFGCSVFGDDFACEVQEIVREVRGDQAIFTDDDWLSEYFIDEQLALQCAIETRDLDACVAATQRAFFFDVPATEIDTIVSALTANDARWLSQVSMLQLIGDNYALIPAIEGGEVTSFVQWRVALHEIFTNFDRLDRATGTADGFMSPSELFDLAPGVAGNTAELNDALAWVAANRTRFDTAHDYFGIGNPARIEALRDEMVRTEAYTLSPGAALQTIREFPLVGQGGRGVDIRLFESYEPQVRALVNDAVASTGAGDRVIHNEIVSRMPETTGAIRNDLITAMYIEYGQAVQEWLGAGKGGNWGLIAPWASQGVNPPIRGEFPAIFFGPRQAAADGNQWIFNNIGSRYAAFVEMIEADPTPTIPRWEQFFATNFGAGDQAIRDGFVALAAAFYETDLDRAQVLLFQSNALLATHEQAGVQLHLEEFDIAIANDQISTWFVDLDMGQNLRLEVDQDVYGNVGIAEEGVAPANHRFWDIDMLTLDPTGDDASSIYDVPGVFDVNVGGADVVGVMDVSSLSGVGASTPPSWTIWRNGARPGDTLYSGSGAGVWWDWEERMWYLLNLFRVLHTDTDVAVAPGGRSLSDPVLTQHFDAGVLGRLSIN